MTTDQKELREFSYKPYTTYSKIKHTETMRRIDFLGHQVEALTDEVVAQREINKSLQSQLDDLRSQTTAKATTKKVTKKATSKAPEVE